MGQMSPQHLATIPRCGENFPRAGRETWITSPIDFNYNCIAWAAEDTTHFWWPEQLGFWPAEAPRNTSLEAFLIAFATLGYAPCSDGNLVPGMQKVAFYGKGRSVLHAARQLSDGKWSSKLGRAQDVSHDLSSLEGPAYGIVIQFVERPAARPQAAEHSPPPPPSE